MYFDESLSIQTFSFPGLERNSTDLDRAECIINTYKLKYNNSGTIEDYASTTHISDPKITPDGATNFKFSFSATDNSTILTQD